MTSSFTYFTEALLFHRSIRLFPWSGLFLLRLRYARRGYRWSSHQIAWKRQVDVATLFAVLGGSVLPSDTSRYTMAFRTASVHHPRLVYTTADVPLFVSDTRHHRSASEPARRCWLKSLTADPDCSQLSQASICASCP